MKKLSLAIVLAVAVLLMTGCRKSNVQPLGGSEPTGETIDVALDAGTGDDKTTIDGYSISWVVGDKIHVVGTLDGYLGYMTAQSSGNPVKFKGTIKKTTAAQNYYFYYVGDNDFTLSGDNVYTFSVASQHGSLSGNANSITNKLQLMKGSMYVSGTPGAELGAVTLNCMMSIIRLNLQTNGTSMTSGTVTVSGGYSSVKINTKTGEYVSSSPLTSGNITLNNASGSYYMAVITGNQTSSGTSQTLTFTSSSCSTSFTATIAANKFYNKDSAKAVNMEPVETDEWINFGLPEPYQNLKWAKKNIGATNGSTAQSWYGDYYAWGATTTWYVAGTGHSNPPTWKTSPKDYSGGYVKANAPYYSGSAYTKYTSGDGKTTLEDADDVACQHASWGGSWRMPTGGADGEWKLLKDNTYFLWTTNYNGISDLRGYIVYKVKDSAHKGYLTSYSNSTWNTKDSSGTVVSDYEGQQNPFSYTASDPHMFLPAAGYFYGASLYDAGSYGLYWSSSLYSVNPGSAWGMYFYSGNVNPQSIYNRYDGFSVRPVQ